MNNRTGLILLARALTLPDGPAGAVELPDDPLDLLSADERFSLALERALKGTNPLRVVGTYDGAPAGGAQSDATSGGSDIGGDSR